MKRRDFIRMIGLSAVAAPSLTACQPKATSTIVTVKAAENEMWDELPEQIETHTYDGNGNITGTKLINRWRKRVCGSGESHPRL
jgi:hypothetical protein